MSNGHPIASSNPFENSLIIILCFYILFPRHVLWCCPKRKKVRSKTKKCDPKFKNIIFCWETWMIEVDEPRVKSVQLWLTLPGGVEKGVMATTASPLSLLGRITTFLLTRPLCITDSFPSIARLNKCVKFISISHNPYNIPLCRLYIKPHYKATVSIYHCSISKGKRGKKWFDHSGKWMIKLIFLFSE